MYKVILLSILTLTLLSACGQKPIPGYLSALYSGYSVYISTEASNHPRELQETLLIIQEKLSIIKNLPLSSDMHAKLTTIPIFLEWNMSEHGAQYHPSKIWLLEHGYIAEKEQSIEISNMRNFMNWTRMNQPYMLMHELAHAYMDKYLTSQEQGIILATYQDAISRGLYQKVEYHESATGSAQYLRAYAASNEKEYFSEITEAYLGQNDYYPFSKEDLRVYDPNGYRLMETTWR